MGWIRKSARRVREDVSRKVFDKFTDWIVGVCRAVALVIVTVLIVALWPWLSREWANGAIFGSLFGLGVFLLMVFATFVGNKINKWHERRRLATVAPCRDVDLFRQLYLKRFSPLVNSAVSYLGSLCDDMDGSMQKAVQQLSSLLKSDILNPCSRAMEETGRQIVVTAVPGRLPVVDFDKLKDYFVDLTEKYSRVAQQIELAKRVAAAGQRSQEYDALCRQHVTFVAELKDAADTCIGLKKIAKFHETLKQYLSAPSADPP